MHRLAGPAQKAVRSARLAKVTPQKQAYDNQGLTSLSDSKSKATVPPSGSCSKSLSYSRTGLLRSREASTVSKCLRQQFSAQTLTTSLGAQHTCTHNTEQRTRCQRGRASAYTHLRVLGNGSAQPCGKLCACRPAQAYCSAP